jgi:hypothetical protein
MKIFNTISILIITLLYVGSIQSQEQQDDPESASRPVAVIEQPQILTGNVNVTAYLGDTVNLPCEVVNLGNYHVNWLRIQNNNIPQTLTVGYQQFSRNMRYRVARTHHNHNANNNNQHQPTNLDQRKVESWNFEIRKASYDDQGLYECYIKLNSKHKIKANINLIVKSDKERVITHHRSNNKHDSNFYGINNCNLNFY